MTPTPSANRTKALLVTLGVFGFAVAAAVFLSRPGGPETAGPLPAGLENQARAADTVARGWPMFGGSLGRNMVNTVEKNLVADFDAKTKKNVKWVAKLGSRSYGGPTFGNGKILLGTNNDDPRDPKHKGDKGVVMCFNQADGKLLWQAVHDKLESGQVNDYPEQGICSAPFIEGDRAYYVSNRSEVVCVDLNGPAAGLDAKFIWKYDMMKELNNFPHNLSSCSPLVVGDTIFLVTSNGVDEGHINIPSPKAPSFIALDKKTGALKWQNNSPSIRAADAKGQGIKDLTNRGLALMHGQWANPSYAVVNGKPQVVFPGGDGWLYSFNPADGKLIWKFDANPKDAKYSLGGNGTRSDFIATPVIVDNHLFIGTGQDPDHYTGVGHLWCIDITKEGDVSPEIVLDDKPFPPKTKANPNSAVVWHFGGMASEADAEKLGRDFYYGRTMSTAAVHDGLLYTAEVAGYIHCLDAKTGHHYWSQDLKSSIWGSPTWIDGKVYIGTDDGDVWVFPEGKELKEPKKFDMGNSVKSTPVAADGVLYVMTESFLYALGKK
jgi:outer membrane protein assembly factor BamB